MAAKDEAPVPRGRPIGPPDGHVVPRFAGPDTFARLPRLGEVAGAQVAVVGVPFDSGTTYRPGARFGPSAVRAGSKLLRPYHPDLGIQPFAVHQVVDAGDFALNPFSIEEAVATIDREARALLRHVPHLVALGGDHTIALPLLRTAAEAHGPLAVVHFDAHLDTWDTYFGAPYTHGTPFRRAAEEGLLAAERAVHIGVRGPLYAESDLAEDAGLGFVIVSTTDVARRGVDFAIDAILRHVGNLPVYISIDIDVLDPAHTPGTGTPEPGGLTTRELQLILRGLEQCHLVGGDLVEVAPAYDHAELTAVAGASLVYELLAILARR